MNSTAADATWYFEHAGRRIGPVSFAVLQELARRGKLQVGALVWRAETDETAGRQRADTVIGLEFAQALAAPARAMPVPAIAAQAAPAAPVQTPSQPTARQISLAPAPRPAWRVKAGVLTLVCVLAAAGVYWYPVLLAVFHPGSRQSPPPLHVVKPARTVSAAAAIAGQARFEAVPLFAAIKAADPEAFGSLRADFLAGIQGGVSEGEMAARIHTQFISRFLPRYLKTGVDAPLVAYWKVQLDEMRELRQLDPRYCREFLFSQKSPDRHAMSGLLSKEILDRDANSLVDLIRQTALSPRAPPAGADVQQGLRIAARNAEARTPGTAAVLQDPDRYADEPEVVCDAALAFFGAIVEQPPGQSGPVLRFLARNDR